MLILQRRNGESVRIGEDIEVTVVAIEGNKVRLAISAPSDVTILRSELIGARDTNRDAAAEQSIPAELMEMLETLAPAAPGAQPTMPLKTIKPVAKKSE